MSKSDAPFFVGYLNIPKGLKGFLLKVSLLLFFGFTAGALLAGATQDDPGQAGFRFDFGRQTVEGVIQAKPYPLLHVTKGNERIEIGETLMLTGQGKSGAMASIAALEGTVIEATGILLNRGELRMLQLLGGNRGFKSLETDGPVPASESLGTWRLQGEICDGKCLAGAMQPGRGLAHKACANLCLIGDIPPVFVSSQPIDGEEYFLVGSVEGGSLSAAAYDYVGNFVEIEAALERQGDLMVLKLDPKRIKVIR
ncbi:MAG: hypothetical protein QNJ29_03210 [Rhizobiaceae bacterium]|nr:hypothetical protein [Rhizobiaceae bacterium]